MKSFQPAIMRFSLFAGVLFMALIMLSALVGHTLQADRIVFLSNHAGGYYKFYEMDIRRGLIHKVNNVEMVPYYEVSPDEQRILYMQAVNSLPAIFTMKLDGTDIHQLVERPGTSPAWSPDSQSVAFAILGENNKTTSQIYRVNSDGIDLRPLTELPLNENPYLPNWSPNGRQIIFQGMISDSEVVLYLMNADGSGLQRLNYSREFDNIFTLKWSPDSHHFAFLGRFFNDDRSVLSTSFCLSEAELTRIKCFDNTSLGALQDSILNSFAWSPDSTQVAFVSAYGMSIASIEIIDIETITTHQVLRYKYDVKKKSIGNLIWTPDGRRLIYEVVGSMGPNHGTQLYSVNIDDSEERSLTGGSFTNILPT
jgi:Tol biopolymer transport system component